MEIERSDGSLAFLRNSLVPAESGSLSTTRMIDIIDDIIGPEELFKRNREGAASPHPCRPCYRPPPLSTASCFLLPLPNPNPKSGSSRMRVSPRHSVTRFSRVTTSSPHLAECPSGQPPNRMDVRRRYSQDGRRTQLWPACGIRCYAIP